MSTVKVKTTFKDVINFLEKEKTTLEQQNQLINHFIKHINGFPFEEVIKINEVTQVITVNGKELTPDAKNNFLQGISVVNNNLSFRILTDQVMYKAIEKGFIKSETLENQYFGKVAFFIFDLYKQYLNKLDRR